MNMSSIAKFREIDQQLMQHALGWALTVAVIVGLLAMGGCAELQARFLAGCSDDVETPCFAPCDITTKAADGKSTVKHVPYAVVTRDQHGAIQCEAVEAKSPRLASITDTNWLP